MLYISFRSCTSTFSAVMTTVGHWKCKRLLGVLVSNVHHSLNKASASKLGIDFLEILIFLSLLIIMVDTYSMIEQVVD